MWLQHSLAGMSNPFPECKTCRKVAGDMGYDVHTILAASESAVRKLCRLHLKTEDVCVQTEEFVFNALNSLNFCFAFCCFILNNCVLAGSQPAPDSDDAIEIGGALGDLMKKLVHIAYSFGYKKDHRPLSASAYSSVWTRRHHPLIHSALQNDSTFCFLFFFCSLSTFPIFCRYLMRKKNAN
uniref:Saposin B-type domain-containing protein n=1 Tax=Heterorhabditis bacteriophora TaxID=37862 RepID=A0A1I7WQK7_HETBA